MPERTTVAPSLIDVAVTPVSVEPPLLPPEQPAALEPPPARDCVTPPFCVRPRTSAVAPTIRVFLLTLVLYTGSASIEVSRRAAAANAAMMTTGRPGRNAFNAGNFN